MEKKKDMIWIDLREPHQLEKMAREHRFTGVPEYDHRNYTLEEMDKQRGQVRPTKKDNYRI